MRRVLVFLFLGLLWLGQAGAAGGGGGGGGGSAGDEGTQFSQQQAADPRFAAAVKAIHAEQYRQAIPLLQGYLTQASRDADAENWLGYAYRKSGDLDAAFVHYDKALAIDPRHRGAHEYVGEAYLMAGQLAKAEEQLKILDSLCWLPCEEYSTLKKAIATYRSAAKNAHSAASNTGWVSSRSISRSNAN